MDLKDLAKRTGGLSAVALSRLLGSRAGENIGILVYHRIAPPTPGVPTPTLNVCPDHFRRQIVELLDRGFTVWPLSKVLQYRAAKQAVPRRTVVVTFDDGFETVYLHAWPVLQDTQVPATVFLTTAFLDAESPFPFDPWGLTHRKTVHPETYRPLRIAQCREMAAGGLIELGAHTHTHQDFRQMPEAFRRDLQTSVDVLRSRFGQQTVTFAFPFGRARQGFVNPALVAAAKQTPVACGLTTECVLVDPESDPFEWGRFNVYDWDTGATLAGKLEGWYGWLPKLQDCLSKPFHKNPVDGDTSDGTRCDAAFPEGRRLRTASSGPEGFR